ncbi:MAG: N-formylglutamate amidohydrolase [Planctomycetia bacterium]|nr:N-formylglutamate amidohydrolase [Planctomycetia bacterium]
MAMFDSVVVTCEHGGNEVPKEFAALFAGHEELLSTHRGYDPGALELARRFAKVGNWPLHFSTTTRLLCDLNRTFRKEGHLSEITESLDEGTVDALVWAYFEPYRTAVEKEIRDLVHDERRVLHLSVHSFTPVLDGEVRNADIGLLYDPKSPTEVAFCDAWHAALNAARPDLAVRRNYPYLGTTDGFTTTLRTIHEPEQYAGVELEVNQRWPLEADNAWQELQAVLVATFQLALNS